MYVRTYVHTLYLYTYTTKFFEVTLFFNWPLFTHKMFHICTIRIRIMCQTKWSSQILKRTNNDGVMAICFQLMENTSPLLVLCARTLFSEEPKNDSMPFGILQWVMQWQKYSNSIFVMPLKYRGLLKATAVHFGLKHERNLHTYLVDKAVVLILTTLMSLCQVCTVC